MLVLRVRHRHQEQPERAVPDLSTRDQGHHQDIPIVVITRTDFVVVVAVVTVRSKLYKCARTDLTLLLSVAIGLSSGQFVIRVRVWKRHYTVVVLYIYDSVFYY